MSKGLRKWLFRLGVFVIIFGGVFFCFVGRIDRTPLKNQNFYTRMMAKLDTLKPAVYPTQSLSSAWGKVNITPDYSMPMAGYRPRPKFESVHDSLFVRAIVIDNGISEAILLSADLLIFPPALKAELESQLAKTDKPTFIFYGATHTHNGLGGWHPAWAAQFAVGDYHDTWIQTTASAIATEIKSIRSDLKASHISYWQADAHSYATNRLKHGNPYDGELRGLKFSRADSTHAYLITFSAHATSINKKSTALSGDYPATLIQNTEQVEGNYAMFMAGMVGSHKLAGITETEFDRAEQAGKLLADKAVQAQTEVLSVTDIKTTRVSIEYGPAQLRLNKDYKLRNWMFASALEPLQGELTCLQLGNVLLIGTPCDFSGEVFVNENLEAYAKQFNKQIIITSFNGGYTGYITEDEHYETSLREEVTTMNWVGPYFGQYYTEMIKRVIEK
jgi:neutral ceramidase